MSVIEAICAATVVWTVLGAFNAYLAWNIKDFWMTHAIYALALILGFTGSFAGGFVAAAGAYLLTQLLLLTELVADRLKLDFMRRTVR